MLWLDLLKGCLVLFLETILTPLQSDVLLKFVQRFVVFILFRDSLYLHLEP